MALKRTRKLIMYEATEITFTAKHGKNKGEEVKKWKYSFFDKEGKIIFGFDDLGEYKDYAVDVDEIKWNEALANDFVFEVRIYRNPTTNEDEQTEVLTGVVEN